MRCLKSCILYISLVVLLTISAFAFPEAVTVSDSIEYADVVQEATLAAQVEGKCGDDVSWKYENGTLTISGVGDMYDYNLSTKKAPWLENKLVIKHVVICDGVTRIGDSAFRGQSALESILFGEDIKSIGQNAFHSCVKLESIEFNEGLEEVEYLAFGYCKGIKEMTFPSTLETVWEKAFYLITLDNLYISDFEKWFGVSFAEADCNPLYRAKNLYIDGVLTTKIEIPETVKEISGYSLASSFAVKEIIIPSALNVVNVDDMRLESLESLYIESLASYMNIKFTGMDWFTRYADNVYVDGILLEELVVPEGVDKIYSGSFNGYTKLKSVEIPSSVQVVNVGAFLTSPVEKYSVDEKNKNYSSDEHGVLFNKDKTELIQYPLMNNSKDYIIPDTVKVVCDGAFENAKYIKSVFIPDSVEEIFDYAFYGTNIESLKIPGSVKYIYGNAFENCTKLEEVLFEIGLEEIYGEAFKNCTSLTSVDLPFSVEVMGKGVFYGCENLENVFLPNLLEHISNEMFYGCSSLKSIKIPTNVVSIGGHAFYGCTGLESVVFVGDVESIESRAFSGCAFESIVLPDSLKIIGDTAFMSCNKLRSIYIPENVEEVSNMAFRGCHSLETVIIDSSADLTGYGIFKNCDSLKNVCIPADIKKMSKGAFDEQPLFTIYGVKDSYVNTFADENGISFESYLACGNFGNLSWIIYDDGLLSIVGNGKMLSLDDSYVASDYPWYDYKDVITAIEVGEGITCISKNAFGDGYSNVKKVTLPTSLIYLVEDAFLGCRKIEEVHIKDLEAWISVDFDSELVNGTYCYSSSPLNYQADLYVNGEKLTFFELSNKYAEDFTIALSGCSSLKEVVIADGIKKIPEGAFSFCTNLEKVTFSDDVLHIDPYAFECCVNLKHINLDTQELWKIGEYAFAGCGLEYVKLPEQIKTISASTFNGCKNLAKIVIPEATEEIAKDAFKDIDNLVIYGVGGSYAETYANENHIPFVEVANCSSGDVNGDDSVDVNDAIYLLQYSLFPDIYEIDGYSYHLDYNSDGTVDMNDAVLLLQHSLFPDMYPLFD